MNDQNKPKLTEDSPKIAMGGTAVKPSAWRKILSKKWAAPAAFMAAAAIIVTLMWIYRGADETPAATNSTGSEITQGDEQSAETASPKDETLEVTSSNELMQWPVANHKELQIVAPFYDEKASSDERQTALIQSGNTFMANTGIDLARADDKTFDVIAALSGKVVVAEKHPLNGNVVEIKHADGLVTVYQSLTDLQVKVGDEVKQGTIIAKAGRSELEQDLGVHLHFEARKDGKPLNPSTLLGDE